MIKFSVFSKPWSTEPIPEMGKFLKNLGFDGVELPIRPNFQVEPENVERDLPEAVKQLKEEGIEVFSVAGPTDEKTIEACAAAEIPIIRICANIKKLCDDKGIRYRDGIESTQKEFESVIPVLERTGIRIGVQNHCNGYLGSAIGIMNLIRPFNPKHIAAVWDPAHCALAGEPVSQAADIFWDKLCMVNLKNACYLKESADDADVTDWRMYWCAGQEGLAKWPDVKDELSKRNYNGVICLTAEYSDHDKVDDLIEQDIAYAKKLFDK